MNFLLGNKKPGFSFLWLCPPYELDPRIQPRSELVPSYSLSFKKVCCLPSPQELLSALHCRRPRKVLLAPRRSHWWTSQKDIYWQAGQKPPPISEEPLPSYSRHWYCYCLVTKSCLTLFDRMNHSVPDTGNDP